MKARRSGRSTRRAADAAYGRATCWRATAAAAGSGRTRACPCATWSSTNPGSRWTPSCTPARAGRCRAPTSSTASRWELMLDKDEDPKEMAEPRVVWRASAYRFHALVLRQWRTERLFFLGDAAHMTPPFLAQGMCQGIRDASNLVRPLPARSTSCARRSGPGDSIRSGIRSTSSPSSTRSPPPGRPRPRSAPSGRRTGRGPVPRRPPHRPGRRGRTPLPACCAVGGPCDAAAGPTRSPCPQRTSRSRRTVNSSQPSGAATPCGEVETVTIASSSDESPSTTQATVTSTG